MALFYQCRQYINWKSSQNVGLRSKLFSVDLEMKEMMFYLQLSVENSNQKWGRPIFRANKEGRDTNRPCRIYITTLLGVTCVTTGLS